MVITNGCMVLYHQNIALTNHKPTLSSQKIATKVLFVIFYSPISLFGINSVRFSHCSSVFYYWFLSSRCCLHLYYKPPKNKCQVFYLYLLRNIKKKYILKKVMSIYLFYLLLCNFKAVQVLFYMFI